MLIDKSIQDLRKEVSLMARRCEEIFEKAGASIWVGDESVVEAVRAMDIRIDEDEMRIDRMCMELLALKEPYGIDFRYVFSVVKSIIDLERVGDQSKTIAKWARKLSAVPGEDMRELREKSAEALRTAVDALTTGDAGLAREVMQLEFQVDLIEDRIIEQSTDVAEAFIAKALERIGDLATNIAENVIFSVKAEDIRHGNFNSPSRSSVVR